MRVLTADLRRKPEPRSGLLPGLNPFTLTVTFAIDTAADAESVAVLMRALKDKRQNIQIGVK